MSKLKNLKIAIDNGVALITIDRPRALNALNEETLKELSEVFQERMKKDDVATIIITGSGDKAFIAGADIRELTQLDLIDSRNKSIRGQVVCETIENFPKPVIAAINGYCLGGGCELALSCHIRLMAREVKIGFPEVKLGLIPGYAGTQRLSRLVGKGRAMEMILSGENISAEQAEKIGLVNHVVLLKDLILESRKLALKIGDNAPLAIRYAIEAINRGLEMPFDRASQLEATFFSLLCATEDGKEGIQAFTEKKKPHFKGK
jgi:enoyl-CoA hydratase